MPGAKGCQNKESTLQNAKRGAPVSSVSRDSWCHFVSPHPHTEGERSDIILVRYVIGPQNCFVGCTRRSGRGKQRSESMKVKNVISPFGPYFPQQKTDVMGCGGSCISLMWGRGFSEEDGGFG